MSPTACPSTEQLRQFNAGALPSGANRIASHLDGCAACRTAVGHRSNRDVRLPPVAAPHEQKFAFRHESEYRRVEASLREIRQETQQTDRQQLSRLGEYELLEKIGQGGMGTVYKARHGRLDRLVAIKVLSRERLCDGNAVARFHREMSAIGRLDHPNVVAGLDAGEADGEHFLVMELLDGINLSGLESCFGQLKIPDACELIRQACLGLHHAHELGMIHRDVKPSNLILCRNAHGEPLVKVLDMGLARFSEHHQPIKELTATGQMMGTLEFMAPEQGMGGNSIDHRADIYSMGATLYKLLCGRTPYDGDRFDTPLKMMQALANEAPSLIGNHRQLPAELVELIDCMLSRAPEDRPATLQEVADALQPYTHGADLLTLLGSYDTQQTAEDTDVPVVTQDEIHFIQRDATSNTDFAAHDGTSPAVVTRASRLASVTNRLWLAGAMGGMLLLSVVFLMPTRHGIVRVEINDPNIEVTVDGNKRLFVNDGTSELEVTPGPHRLYVKAGDATLRTDNFEVSRGENIALHVTLLPGAKVRVTKDGTVIGEKELQEAASLYQGPPRQLRFGDKVNITTSGNRWLAAAMGSWVIQYGQRLQKIISMRPGNDQELRRAARLFNWTICSGMKLKNEAEPDVINFGDKIYLAVSVEEGRTEWLTGNRSPHDLSSFSVFASDAGSEHEKKHKLAWYAWQIRKSPEETGRGPVSYGSPFHLGCQYSNSDLGYDGFSFLHRGSGEELGEVRAELLRKSPSDPDTIADYTWQTLPASESGPVEVDAKPVKAADAAICYGDRIYLSLWDGISWLSGNTASTQTIDRQELRNVQTVWSNRSSQQFAWTIRRSVSEKDTGHDVVRYGDDVCLTDGTNWLVGHPMIATGEANVFCGDPATDKAAKNIIHQWRIQSENNMLLSAAKSKKYGQPVHARDIIWLGCRYTKKAPAAGFDGYALLSGGRGEGDVVRTVWTTEPYAKQSHCRWKIQLASQNQ